MKSQLCMLIALLNGSVSQAQNTDPIEMHSSTDINLSRIQKQVQNNHQLKLFFDGYLDHYNDYLSDRNNQLAITKAADNYHQPAIQIIPNIPLRVVNNRATLVSGTQGFLDKLRTSGVDHIAWEKINIHQLSDSSAIASNIGVRYKNNGDIFNKAAATFIMHKSKLEWKIAALTLHDVENTIEFK